MDFNCVICLENINNYTDKKTLDCEHMYHKNCINQVQNNKCPLCNKHIVDDKLKKCEDLYKDLCKHLELTENENKELKEALDSDTFLNDINNSIDKSIKVNKYKKDITNHYIIKKSLIPFHCKYCNFKTTAFGFLYNHLNKNHYQKITPTPPISTSAFGNAATFINNTTFYI